MRSLTICLFAALGAGLLAGVFEGVSQGQSPTKPKEAAKPAVDASKIAGKSFEQWLKEIATKDPSKRETAIRAVCSFPPEIAIKAIPTLLFELRKHSTAPVDLSVRCNLCTSLAELFGSGERIDAKLKAEAVALLRFQLRDTQAILRYRAATALSALGPDALPAIPDLMAMFRDGSTWEVRQAAAAAIGAIAGDGASGPNPAHLENLYKVLHDPAYQVRLAAIQSLSILGPGTDQNMIDAYVSALTPIALKDPEPGLQIWARIAVIGATKDFSLTNIAPITKHLTSVDPGIRMQAVQALGAIGPQAKTSVASLVTALKDDDQGVQLSAMWALGRMEAAAAVAMPALEKIAADPNQADHVKRSAKDALEKIKGK
ncbi:MAG: HEAT repeat domain-containing protein [Planctomycetota bacterium]|jgi:HEAT repeat protein